MTSARLEELIAPREDFEDGVLYADILNPVNRFIDAMNGIAKRTGHEFGPVLSVMAAAVAAGCYLDCACDARARLNGVAPTTAAAGVIAHWFYAAEEFSGKAGPLVVGDPASLLGVGGFAKDKYHHLVIDEANRLVREEGYENLAVLQALLMAIGRYAAFASSSKRGYEHSQGDLPGLVLRSIVGAMTLQFEGLRSR